jgi:hypothetical protein
MAQATGGRLRIPKKRDHGSRAPFLERVLRIAMAIHLPVVVAFTGAAEALKMPWPWLTGLALAAVLTLPIRGRLASMMWDRHRPKWERLFVDEAYFVHFCATFGAAVPITATCLVAPLIDLARGLPPRIPTTAALGIYLVFLAIAVWGVVVRRRWVVVRRVDVKIRELPAAFDGYRIVQLSDLHVGGISPKEVASRWVRLANAEKADLAVLTGDYVTSGVAFHDDIAEVMAGLDAKDGTFASLGNHDYFGEGDPLIDKIRARGVTVLRNESHRIERGGESIRLAGVDDTWTGRADLGRTLEGGDGQRTVLLAHDPDVFEEAARLGADLVLSGHTHGGQVAFPFLVRQINLSRLVHRHTYGLYSHGDSTLYVHGGLGTTGPPFRLGVPPEVVVLTLRRA